MAPFTFQSELPGALTDRNDNSKVICCASVNADVKKTETQKDGAFEHLFFPSVSTGCYFKF